MDTEDAAYLGATAVGKGPHPPTLTAAATPTPTTIRSIANACIAAACTAAAATAGDGLGGPDRFGGGYSDGSPTSRHPPPLPPPAAAPDDGAGSRPSAVGAQALKAFTDRAFQSGAFQGPKEVRLDLSVMLLVPGGVQRTAQPQPTPPGEEESTSPLCDGVGGGIFSAPIHDDDARDYDCPDDSSDDGDDDAASGFGGSTDSDDYDGRSSSTATAASHGPLPLHRDPHHHEPPAACPPQPATSRRRIPGTLGPDVIAAALGIPVTLRITNTDLVLLLQEAPSSASRGGAGGGAGGSGPRAAAAAAHPSKAGIDAAIAARREELPLTPLFIIPRTNIANITKFEAPAESFAGLSEAQSGAAPPGIFAPHPLNHSAAPPLLALHPHSGPASIAASRNYFGTAAGVGPAASIGGASHRGSVVTSGGPATNGSGGTSSGGGVGGIGGGGGGLLAADVAQTPLHGFILWTRAGEKVHVYFRHDDRRRGEWVDSFLALLGYHFLTPTATALYERFAATQQALAQPPSTSSSSVASFTAAATALTAPQLLRTSDGGAGAGDRAAVGRTTSNATSASLEGDWDTSATTDSSAQSSAPSSEAKRAAETAAAGYSPHMANTTEFREGHKTLVPEDAGPCHGARIVAPTLADEVVEVESDLDEPDPSGGSGASGAHASHRSHAANLPWWQLLAASYLRTGPAIAQVLVAGRILPAAVTGPSMDGDADVRRRRRKFALHVAREVGVFVTALTDIRREAAAPAKPNALRSFLMERLFSLPPSKGSSSSARPPFADAPTARLAADHLASWFTFHLFDEMRRQHLGRQWGISDINQHFTACPTYPPFLVVPAALCPVRGWHGGGDGSLREPPAAATGREDTAAERRSHDTLAESFRLRSAGRIQTLTYYHAFSGAAILRSSQPLGAAHLVRQGAFLEMQRAMVQASPSRRLLIMDLRPYTNAMANILKGGSFEGARGDTSVQFAGIGNIHCVRNSYQALWDLCQSGARRLQLHRDACHAHTAAAIASAEHEAAGSLSARCGLATPTVAGSPAGEFPPSAGFPSSFNSDHVPPDRSAGGALSPLKGPGRLLPGRMPSVASLSQLDESAKAAAAEDQQTTRAGGIIGTIQHIGGRFSQVMGAVASGMPVSEAAQQAAKGDAAKDHASGAHAMPFDGASQRYATSPSALQRAISDTQWLDLLFIILTTSVEVAQAVAGSSAYLHSPLLAPAVLQSILAQHRTEARRFRHHRREQRRRASVGGPHTNTSVTPNSCTGGGSARFPPVAGLCDDTMDDMARSNVSPTTATPTTGRPPSLRPFPKAPSCTNLPRGSGPPTPMHPSVRGVDHDRQRPQQVRGGAPFAASALGLDELLYQSSSKPPTPPSMVPGTGPAASYSPTHAHSRRGASPAGAAAAAHCSTNPPHCTFIKALPPETFEGGHASTAVHPPATRSSGSSSNHHAGTNVLVHCSDGWDRTAQVCALSKLLLDPHYRTVMGLCALIEADFVSFGHQFRVRSDHLACHRRSPWQTNHTSPVFVQFIDAVYQLTVLNPRSFEFSEGFLLFILDIFSSGLTATFSANNPADLVESRAPLQALSLSQLVALVVTACPFGPTTRGDLDQERAAACGEQCPALRPTSHRSSGGASGTGGPAPLQGSSSSEGPTSPLRGGNGRGGSGLGTASPPTGDLPSPPSPRTPQAPSAVLTWLRDHTSLDALTYSGFFNEAFEDLERFPSLPPCEQCAKRARRRREGEADQENNDTDDNRFPNAYRNHPHNDTHNDSLVSSPDSDRYPPPHTTSRSHSQKNHGQRADQQVWGGSGSGSPPSASSLLYCPLHQEGAFKAALLRRPAHFLVGPIGPASVRLWEGFFFRRADGWLGRGIRRQLMGSQHHSHATAASMVSRAGTTSSASRRSHKTTTTSTTANASPCTFATAATARTMSSGGSNSNSNSNSGGARPPTAGTTNFSASAPMSPQPTADFSDVPITAEPTLGDPEDRPLALGRDGEEEAEEGLGADVYDDAGPLDDNDDEDIVMRRPQPVEPRSSHSATATATAPSSAQRTFFGRRRGGSSPAAAATSRTAALPAQPAAYDDNEYDDIAPHHPHHHSHHQHHESSSHRSPHSGSSSWCGPSSVLNGFDEAWDSVRYQKR